MAGPFSPLFRLAAREIRTAARREFERSAVGQLLGEVRRVTSSAADPGDRLRRTLERYGRGFDPRRAVRDVMGIDFRGFAGEVSRYTRGGGVGRALVNEFLSALGPAGRILRSLFASGGGGSERQLDRDIAAAIRFLETFGYEVLPSKRARRLNVGEVSRGAEKSLEFLRQIGYPIGEEVLYPGEEQLPFGVRRRTPAGQPRTAIEIKTFRQGKKEYPVDHPLVTGEMVDATPSSSNVHSYGYDVEKRILYVRFIAPEAKKGLKPGEKPPHVPGPLYSYAGVPEDLFEQLLETSGKGDWIWDHLRVRGTVSGHQYEYRLVGITGDYVPRKAEFGLFAPAEGEAPLYGEWYRPRALFTQEQGWLTSSRPLELVQQFTPKLAPERPQTRSPRRRS